MVRKYISGVGSTLLSYMCHIGITTWAYLYVGTIMLVRGSTSLPNVIKVQQFFSFKMINSFSQSFSLQFRIKLPSISSQNIRATNRRTGRGRRRARARGGPWWWSTCSCARWCTESTWSGSRTTWTTSRDDWKKGDQWSIL